MTPLITPNRAAAETTFADLGVRDEIVQALKEEGVEHPFAIQELTLPLALTGDDLIGQARTGMGKTFAFGVPLLQRITTAGPDRPLSGIPRALIVVPTRELCLQVYGDLSTAAKYLTADDDRKVSVVCIYGGRPYEPQIEALRAGADVVVGTPGRLLDLAQQGHLQLGGLSVLVLDEADEMLDLGFLPDIERILRQIPDERQAMLFSATMPDPIITLARTFMNQPTHIRAEAPHSSAVHDLTKQYVYRAHAMDKVELVSRVLQARGRGATMVFTRTKRTAQKVADELAERGFAVGAVHGDLGQIAREKALKQFRAGDIDVLVATDVAARGIDIDDITHVDQLPVPGGREGLRAPHRPHRPGRQDRYRGHAGRLGRAGPLDDDRQGARPGLPGPGRDLLQLAAPLRRAGHPDRRPGLHRSAEEIAGQAPRRALRWPQRRRARAAAQQQPAATPHPRRQVGDGPCRCRTATPTRMGRRQPRTARPATAPGHGGVAAAPASRRARRPAPTKPAPLLPDGQAGAPHQS